MQPLVSSGFVVLECAAMSKCRTRFEIGTRKLEFSRYMTSFGGLIRAKRWALPEMDGVKSSARDFEATALTPNEAALNARHLDSKGLQPGKPDSRHLVYY
jgi:hypothetical protein